MASDVIFMGWDRPVAGREASSGALFQETQQYLGGLVQAGTIDSFETVLLSPHGGDLNGFILIRGEAAKLAGMQASEEWQRYTPRGTIELERLGLVTGVPGEGVMAWMQRWMELIQA